MKHYRQELPPRRMVDRRSYDVMIGRVMLDQIADFGEMKADPAAGPDENIHSKR